MGKRYEVTYGQMRKSELIPGALIGERKVTVIEAYDGVAAKFTADLFLEGRPLIDLVELPPLGKSPVPNPDLLSAYEAN